MPDTARVMMGLGACGSPSRLVDRVEFDLRNGRGWRVATVSVVLRLDSASVHLDDGRVLAVVDRDRFREWLIHPGLPLEIDDIVWSMEAGVTCLIVDGSVSYAVPEGVVARLVAGV